MTPPLRVDLDTLRRPARLRDFVSDFRYVEMYGNVEAARVVAIVGSRKPKPASLDYAHALAGKLARRGCVIASGGAVGIDRAAHQGALDAGGRTWAILPGGHPQVSPGENQALFARIVASGGSVVWTGINRPRGLLSSDFHKRNRLLVALSDAVVVVQAAEQSGSRHAARSARELRRELWVVAPSPWLDRQSYAGNVAELEDGDGYARPLYDEAALFAALALGDGRGEAAVRTGEEVTEVDVHPDTRDDSAELAVLRLLRDAGPEALHVDEIGVRTGLAQPAAALALLTLCLEAVVVEGPGGFYRRRPIRSATAAGRFGGSPQGRERPSGNKSGNNSHTGAGFVRDGGRSSSGEI